MIAISNYPNKRFINFCRNAIKKISPHTDIISNVSILALNITIFTSKIFSQISKTVPRVAFFLLNFSGIIWMNVQIQDLIKSGKDLVQAIQIRDYSGIFLTALKVLYKATNILLTLAMLAASLASLSGGPATALVMYAIMRPVAIASLVISVGMEISDFFHNRKILIQLRKIHSDQKIQNISQQFLRVGQVGPERKIAVRIYRRLDHYTIKTYQSKLSKKRDISKEYLKVIFEKIKKSIEDKQKFTQANLGLIGLNYACLGISRIFPNTLLQSTLCTGISLIYTIKNIFEKIQNRKLKNSL